MEVEEVFNLTLAFDRARLRSQEKFACEYTRHIKKALPNGSAQL